MAKSIASKLMSVGIKHSLHMLPGLGHITPEVAVELSSLLSKKTIPQVALLCGSRSGEGARLRELLRRLGVDTSLLEDQTKMAALREVMEAVASSDQIQKIQQRIGHERLSPAQE